jgi:hypothetical protein
MTVGLILFAMSMYSFQNGNWGFGLICLIPMVFAFLRVRL